MNLLSAAVRLPSVKMKFLLIRVLEHPISQIREEAQDLETDA